MFSRTVPRSGFTGYGFGKSLAEQDIATTHDVASTSDFAKVFPLGTIVSYFNPALKGYGMCAYMSAVETSSSSIVIGTCLTLVAGSHTSLTDDASAGAVGDAAAEGGYPAAIAISDMTTLYYGWYWIKGVCPDLYISATAKLSSSNTITSAGDLGAMSSFTASTVDGEIDLYDNNGSQDLAVIGMTLVADEASTHLSEFGDIRLTGYGWGV